MRVITGLFLFYILIVLQETANITSSIIFYRMNFEDYSWSVLVTGLYLSSSILYAFPTFYKSIVIGLASQLYAVIVNVLVLVMFGVENEKSSLIHIQVIGNLMIDIFKYAIGLALFAFVKKDTQLYDLYHLEM